VSGRGALSGRAAVSRAVLLAVLRAPVTARTWRSVAYTLLSLVPAAPAFVVALFGLVGGVLSLAVVGLPLLTLALAAARLSVRAFRRPARALLGWDWPDPVPLTGSGPLGRARAVLADGRAWRALAYCFLRLPLAAASGYLAVTALGIGVASLTCPLWSAVWTWSELDSWWESWMVATGGAIVLLIFPWLMWPLVRLDRLLVGWLLTPGPAAERIARLESGRAALTAGAATTLRRLERDLHDGTQARLVSLGVALSRIERRLDRLPGDTGEIRELVSAARDSVTEGLAELRDIVRGIHPPALDDGLATALSTLATRSGLPVEVAVDLTAPPPGATASTVYFAAAELLTNAARHAGANRVALRLTEDSGALRLVVTDDGRGGAAAAATADGTGLSGLARRAEALDGRLEIVSPAGGPTTVTVTLPRG
jgi:signal transduction histidine kinase